MIIGLHSRENDLVVNPLKKKQLTNIRAAGKDDALLLTPPIRMSLEQALEFLADDELLEVTPGKHPAAQTAAQGTRTQARQPRGLINPANELFRDLLSKKQRQRKKQKNYSRGGARGRLPLKGFFPSENRPFVLPCAEAQRKDW
jgi:hypothetical protein